MEKVCAGRELSVDLCVGGRSLLVQMCVCVCVEMAGLELPDVEWATCLPGPKHRNFPLTAEINQTWGISTARRGGRVCVCVCVCVFVRVFICGRMSMSLYMCLCVCVTTKFLYKGRLRVFAKSVDLSSAASRRNSTLSFIDGCRWEDTNTNAVMGNT